MTQPADLRPDVRGKVRDIYDLGTTLLMVATDRISAFDVVLPDPIPYKGEVLTKLSLFWFDLLAGIVGNHLLSADVADLPDQFKPHADYLRGRFMLVKKAEVFPVECIVRGYLAGSGWAEYQRTGTVCGQMLPPGLVESDRLTEPIFTPSTKATTGHDMNIPVATMFDLVGEEYGRAMMETSIAVYAVAREYASERGIIIADTKFEFGLIGEHVTLVDEVLTPDSSRFWPADEYDPGRSQPSFDKQFVRDWLESAGWDKEPPAPRMPHDVVWRTSQKYVQAYELLTGRTFVPESSPEESA